MLLLRELCHDLKYPKDVIIDNANSEFRFDGKNGPIIALHGVGGCWAKNGFRKYLEQNNVCGTLAYFGAMTDNLDNHVDKIAKYIDRYANPFIIGFSAGGIIALKYAEKYRAWNKLRRIITIATPLFGSPIASKLGFVGKTFEQLSVGSMYLEEVRKIKPPKGKVLSVFAEKDLKAPFENVQTVNWEVMLTGAQSHGEIHNNYKIIEPIINKELGI
jgi:pimeloyl-ACP methyl ester carboxylesterase